MKGTLSRGEAPGCVLFWYFSGGEEMLMIESFHPHLASPVKGEELKGGGIVGEVGHKPHGRSPGNKIKINERKNANEK